MKIWLVVKYYLMNISFKFHKDPSFHRGDMAKICSAGVFAPPPESSALDPPWIGLKMKLKFIFSQCHYFFRGGWVGGWVGGVEEWRIKPSQLSTKLELKLKLKLSLTTSSLEDTFKVGVEDT